MDIIPTLYHLHNNSIDYHLLNHNNQYIYQQQEEFNPDQLYLHYPLGLYINFINDNLKYPSKYLTHQVELYKKRYYLPKLSIHSLSNTFDDDDDVKKKKKKNGNYTISTTTYWYI